MKTRLSATLVAALVAAPAMMWASAPTPSSEPTPEATARIQKQVRHELVMLPWFSIFDDLSFSVQGDTVTLTGEVTWPTLRSSAENVVKRIEGVKHVINKIEVLPLSPYDNSLRWRLARAIYGYPALQRYGMGTMPSIRIIVKNGDVTLEGVVDSPMDRTLAGMRANGVPGAFSVTNNLRVVHG